MRFLQPDLFYAWATLLAVPIVLYLFRPRPRTVLTSTLPFFKWLAREHQDNAWLRRLKQLLSLLITLCVFGAGAAALGKLVVSPEANELKTVVVLIDRSASMGVRQGDGPTTLSNALSLLRERIAGLPAGVGVSVIGYDRNPEVLLARTIDRRVVTRTLDGVEVRPIVGDVDPALKLAHRLAALETPAAIWHVTDFPSPEPSVDDATEGETVEPTASQDSPAGDPAEEELPSNSPRDQEITEQHFHVGMSEPINGGITAFELRRVPLQQARLGYEAFVQIRGTSTSPLPAELEVHREGKLVQLRKLTIQPGGVETLLIPIEATVESASEDAKAGTDEGTGEDGEAGEQVAAGNAGTLTLKLNIEGDVLATDDVLQAWIPELNPIKVLWLSEEPDAFMRLAFSTITDSRDIQILQGSPSAWPPEVPVDVVIFDGWLPDEWPTDIEVIAIEPPRSLGPVQAVLIEGDGLPIDRLRISEREHPLLYGVATERISVRQGCVLDASGPLQPLWTGPSGPVLVAGQTQGQRVLIMAFRPENSERFPLMTSFPIFLANSVYWAAENRLSRTTGNQQQSGDIVELDGEWLDWTPAETNRKPAVDDAQDRDSLASRWHELDRLGLWATETGMQGSSALLAVSETVLPIDQFSEQTSKESTASSSTESSLLRGDLVPALMWSMLVLLLLDSWLYHRHAV